VSGKFGNISSVSKIETNLIMGRAGKLVVLFHPFDLLARRIDGNYRIMSHSKAARRFTPVAAFEYTGALLLGIICGLRGAARVWAVALIGWLVAGLLDPLVWKRLYGWRIRRKASLMANLDIFYLFSVGWFLARLGIIF
jgi:hypothetical protein